MPFDLTAGIVRLLGPDKKTVGTGFIVNDEGLVVTCAHVVKGAGAGPGDIVSLIFLPPKIKASKKRQFYLSIGVPPTLRMLPFCA